MINTTTQMRVIQMSKYNEPVITVPSQAVLDAAIRNAHEERAELLSLLPRMLTRWVSAFWNRLLRTGGTGATAGCS